MTLEQKKEKLFLDLATISNAAEIAKIAYYATVKDTNFRSQKINAKSNQLFNFANDIQKSLGDSVRLKEEHKDFFENEHAVELYRLLQNAMFKSTTFLRYFNNSLEAAPAVGSKDVEEVTEEKVAEVKEEVTEEILALTEKEVKPKRSSKKK